jgi:hypothetical protein
MRCGRADIGHWASIRHAVALDALSYEGDVVLGPPSKGAGNQFAERLREGIRPRSETPLPYRCLPIFDARLIDLDFDRFKAGGDEKRSSEPRAVRRG